MFKNLLKTYSVFNILINNSKRYAGHSKWANIKHTKALKDNIRSNLFTKISRQIRIAIQDGGSSDPKLNLKLEQIIEQAKRANMPAASIQNVIKTAATDKNQAKPFILEIKGPGSCIIICEIFTDKLHVTKQLVATILKKYHSKFLDSGARHFFEEKGIIEVELPKNVTENILESATDHAIECGAEDVQVLDDMLLFTTGATNLYSVEKELQKLNYNIKKAEVEFIPVKTQQLQDDDLEKCSMLYEKLLAIPEVVKLSDNIE